MLSYGQVSGCCFCGKSEKADYRCLDGHYVCEECRLSTPEQLVKNTCKHTVEKDPVKIANLLMKHPAVPAYGTEHHYVASCALLAAMRNLRLFDIDSAKIDKAVRLAKMPPLGSCVLWGACGAAIGVGIAFSIAMRVDIMSGQKRGIVLRLVSDALRDISKLGEPRCCKASVVLALETAKKFLRERHEVKFDDAMPICEFTTRNLEDCLKKSCPLYRESSLG